MLMIIKEKMLVLVSAGNNNNKFYHVTLTSDGTLSKRWGRVGSEGQSSIVRGNEREFDKVVRAKVSKGYKETGIEHYDDHQPQNDLKEIAFKTLLSNASDQTLITLIDELVRQNAHQIIQTSGGRMKVDDNGLVSTELGLVSKKNIDEARDILTKLANAKTRSERIKLLNTYLTLVPQKVSSRRGWDENFINDEKSFTTQSEFLDQLAISLKTYEDKVKASREVSQNSEEEKIEEKYANLFRYKISILEDQDEFDRISRLFESSKSNMHSRVYNKTLKRVYVLSDSKDDEVFAKKCKGLGNKKMELWHGTNVSNVLSILRTGLLVESDKIGTVTINGKMFGYGLYFSNRSTKSLNYANNWRGSSFMFLSDVAMGKIHMAGSGDYHHSHIQKSGKYDSIWAKGRKANVINDEMIVWDADQVKMKYLCEFN